jgi:hypothetical protein
VETSRSRKGTIKAAVGWEAAADTVEVADSAVDSEEVADSAAVVDSAAVADTEVAVVWVAEMEDTAGRAVTGAAPG